MLTLKESYDFLRKNSKTGAGSIIRKNIPPNSLVVGLDKLMKLKKNKRNKKF